MSPSPSPVPNQVSGRRKERIISGGKQFRGNIRNESVVAASKVKEEVSEGEYDKSEASISALLIGDDEDGVVDDPVVPPPDPTRTATPLSVSLGHRPEDMPNQRVIAYSYSHSSGTRQAQARIEELSKAIDDNAPAAADSFLAMQRQLRLQAELCAVQKQLIKSLSAQLALGQAD
ncbi:hypothetical protein IAT40_004685 [Kwoniella sp. CBS 6097]